MDSEGYPVTVGDVRSCVWHIMVEADQELETENRRQSRLRSRRMMVHMLGVWRAATNLEGYRHGDAVPAHVSTGAVQGVRDVHTLPYDASLPVELVLTSLLGEFMERAVAGDTRPTSDSVLSWRAGARAQKSAGERKRQLEEVLPAEAVAESGSPGGSAGDGFAPRPGSSEQPRPPPHPQPRQKALKGSCQAHEERDDI